MIKKVLFSASVNHDIIKNVVKKLKIIKNFDLIVHDPTEDFLDLENLQELFEKVDYLIVKVANERSIDLLHYAKLHDIPSLHDIDTVLMCKNKVALDNALRKTFKSNPDMVKKFLIPKSWVHSLLDVNKFKQWAAPHLPIVIKSHYQHDKYMRFNFLVKEMKEIDDFCKKYPHFLYYDVYIQEFIECDGIDRKIYVIGDKVFGIKRENPIYIYMRDKPNDIDVDMVQRKDFEVSSSIKNLASILSNELKLKIFGFDLIKPIKDKRYYLIDLNEFPGLRGINKIDEVLANFLKDHVNS